MRTPTFSAEVIKLPASDVERALRFYVDQVGFTVDVDYPPKHGFRVVQLRPPGSSCSIQIGNGLTDTPAGSVRNTFLVVTDIDAARRLLLEPGVEVGEIRHKTRLGAWDGFRAGARSFAWRLCQLCQVLHPDGNTWVLQERGYRQCVTSRRARLPWVLGTGLFGR